MPTAISKRFYSSVTMRASALFSGRLRGSGQSSRAKERDSTALDCRRLDELCHSASASASVTPLKKQGRIGTKATNRVDSGCCNRFLSFQ
jgi:hypothetical protein